MMQQQNESGYARNIGMKYQSQEGNKVMKLQNHNQKKGQLMINKKHHVNSERNARAPVKLPNLKSAYLEHPG